MAEQLIDKSPFVYVFRSNGIVGLYHALYITNIYGSNILDELFTRVTFPQTIDQLIRWLRCKYDNTATEYITKLLQHKFLRYVNDKEEKQLIARLQAQVRSPEIQFLYIIPTSVCNLRCKYCHIIDTWADYGTHYMSLNTMQRGIRKFLEYIDNSNSKKEIMFYGGEPLLAKDIVCESILFARDMGFDGNITIFTNGTIIDIDTAKFLSDNNVFIIISMDGPKNIHDKMRCYPDGRGSFDKVAAGYEIYKSAGCSIGISMVLGKHNIPGLKDAVEYIIDRFEPVDLGFSTLHLHQRGMNPAYVDMKLLTDEIISAFKFIRNKGIYVEHIFRRIRPFVEQKPRLKDCPSCGGKLIITPDDNIGFCEAFIGTGRYYYPAKTFSLENEGYNEWKDIAPIMKDVCIRCPAISICGGGCPYDAWVQHGDINSLDSMRCEQSNILLNWLIWELFEQTGSQIIDALDVVIPTYEHRKQIYSKINPEMNTIPLQGYSMYGEKGKDQV
jgi:radical SAM protein with 4Fe4S-binding SPASM domain